MIVSPGPQQAEFSADQIMDGIVLALRDRKLDLIPSLLRLLAVQDPVYARQVLDALSGELLVKYRLVGDHD